MKLKLSIIILLTPLCLAGAELPAEFNKFLEVIAKIESSNNPKAFNKKESAIGIYQIREAYFKDAQEFDRALRIYSHRDCFDPSVAKKVVRAYVQRYQPKGTPEQWAQLHNAGVGWKSKTGAARANLDIYLSKFRKLNKK